MVCFLFKYLQLLFTFLRLYTIRQESYIIKSRISTKTKNMKKLSILILGLMILSVSACRKVTNEYYTTPNQTIYDNLNPNRWTTNDRGITYSATIDFVDTDLYQNGFDGVLVYLDFGNNPNNTNSVYEPIPQTYDGFAYSYVVTQQSIIIQIQNSSGSGVITPPNATVKAKVVMILSEE